MTHDLKILPEYFDAVLSGDKTFEVRSIKDKTFNLGDTLRLREWHYSAEIAGANGGYSGREVSVEVTYILPGITYKGDEAVVMGIFLLRERDEVIRKALGDFRDDIVERKS
jgi:hypothetical protein